MPGQPDHEGTVVAVVGRPAGLQSESLTVNVGQRFALRNWITHEIGQILIVTDQPVNTLSVSLCESLIPSGELCLGVHQQGLKVFHDSLVVNSPGENTGSLV